ncbi:hypothetical protein G7Y89_g6447 [Cudoniella acicularis]|uniref:Uncharacterized protein n=1 Tax=Cudoniella acicularis TaxID=354080 RepID=A0A8H4RM83_9HELO|nr:hypothetical protein G7Y89_g6447 [Cudoniella acicularis]
MAPLASLIFTLSPRDDSTNCPYYTDNTCYHFNPLMILPITLGIVFVLLVIGTITYCVVKSKRTKRRNAREMEEHEKQIAELQRAAGAAGHEYVGDGLEYRGEGVPQKISWNPGAY